MSVRLTASFIVTTLALVHQGSAYAAPNQEPIQPIQAARVSNPAAVELGKALFFDPRLSKSGFIS